MRTVFNQSLWGDEAFSAILSMKSIPEIVRIIIRDTSPPLFNITEHIWFQIFGTSEIAIRSLTSIYFLIAVFFVYKIGEHLWDKKTGILAAILTLLNPFFFAYAFEGRMYSLLAAGVTASMYFFLKRNWFGYIIATAFALYSHHFSIFALFVQGLWFIKELFWGKKKVAFSIFKSSIAIGLLYSPWIIPLYNQTRMVGSGFWLGTPNLKDLGLLLLKYLNISLVLIFLKNWSKNVQKSIFLLSWFLLPILTVWIISQKFQSIFFDRYLLYTIPGAMLLAAPQKRALSKPAIAIVIALFLAADIFYFTHPVKRPFRELANYVKETKKGDDYLINWNASSHHLWESKYYGIPAPLYIPRGGNLPFFVGTALMEPGDVINTLPEKVDNFKINRIGVITSGNVDEIILPGYNKDGTQTFADLKFVWYLK